jgi:hypothetical protein
LKVENVADGYARIDAKYVTLRIVEGEEIVGDALGSAGRPDSARDPGRARREGLVANRGRQGEHRQGDRRQQVSQGLDPESAKIAAALQRDAEAVEQELRDALDEGLITPQEFDAATAASADPADIAKAFEEAAFCLSRTLT